jgi:hypothetical protein
MNINDAFPGTYFKAADVAQPRTLTIATVSIEQMQDGTQKPAISFNESQQKFVLNTQTPCPLLSVLKLRTGQVVRSNCIRTKHHSKDG